MLENHMDKTDKPTINNITYNKQEADDLNEENKRLRQLQNNEIGNLCERVLNIKNSLDVITKYHNADKDSVNLETNLKKRFSRNSSKLDYAENSKNPEIKKLKEENDNLKKENLGFKKERKQYWEIIRLQNQVVEDLSKQYEDLGNILKDYKKKGYKQISSMVNDFFGSNNIDFNSNPNSKNQTCPVGAQSYNYKNGDDKSSV